MRLLADEHIPPAIVSALRAEGHDVAVVGDELDAGTADEAILAFARETDRLILSEDIDFRGGDPDFSTSYNPGILACDTSASAGEIAAAVRRIGMYTEDLSDTVLYVSGNWL